jgi:hypothetical protein
MVAYCSSCREDSGSHSSSHGSRRRYLSDAYLEKSPIFEERAHSHNSRRSDGHRGSMFDVYSKLHKSDIPMFKKGKIIQRKIKGIQIGGAAPRRVQARGEAPSGEWPFDIDVKGGEIITLM